MLQICLVIHSTYSIPVLNISQYVDPSRKGVKNMRNYLYFYPIRVVFNLWCVKICATGDKMTKIIETKEPYLAMVHRTNLYTLRYCYYEPITEWTPNEGSVIVGYTPKSDHIRNLSKDYLTAVSKAFDYAKAQDMKDRLNICKEVELQEYSTATTGIKGRYIAANKQWLEDNGHTFESVTDKMKIVEKNCYKDYFAMQLHIRSLIWPNWETEWEYLRPRNTDDFSMIKSDKISDRDAERFARLMAWRANTQWGAFINLYNTLFVDHGVGSDKQKDYFLNLLNDFDNSDQIQVTTDKIMRSREEQSKLKPVPDTDKRITIWGEVQSVKLQDHEYGSTWKMLLRSIDGYKLWGSIPKQMLEGYADGKPEDLIGREFSFMAYVHRSDDDFFGYFKRPSKVSDLVGIAEVKRSETSSALAYPKS